MFSFGRLTALLLACGVAYGGFVATPPGDRAEGVFDPGAVAADETALWKASLARDEFSVFTNCVLLLREQHRYTWYRALQAGFYLSRATTAFWGIQNRFERVLPDLEDAATVERDFLDAPFEPAAVARAELNWWATHQMPNLDSVPEVGRLMAQEYVLRYSIPTDRAIEAALLRAQAIQLRDAGVDPDWPRITRLLTDSYESLRTAIERGPASRVARDAG
jgi:hypothetical protein